METIYRIPAVFALLYFSILYKLHSNLQILSSLLESYERQSGLKIKVDDKTGAFMIPLGPDLKATLQYSLDT